MTFYYKIRSKKNPELFRMANGKWNKHGKVYDTLSKLRSVITMNMNSDYHRQQVQDWEFIEFTVSVNEVKQLIDVIHPDKIFEMLKK
jgi:hypothetical protein